ncbi:MAG: NfeD family protein [Candidatus Methanoperedenaceae archaeon]|nr:NfeD family protein [Candidatus Methanoperedenaceae archaeon]
MVSIDIGWVMIIAGIGLLVIEASQPGFFVAVPGTTLIVLGAVTLLIPEFAKEWAAVIIVVTALVSSIGTVMMYRKIAPGHKPLSTSRDILEGKTGIVVRAVTPGSISGKVKIDTGIWSATADTEIPEGKRVTVISSEGVHVKVKEI